jgi:hypothetical protein
MRLRILSTQNNPGGHGLVASMQPQKKQLPTIVDIIGQLMLS